MSRPSPHPRHEVVVVPLAHLEHHGRLVAAQHVARVHHRVQRLTRSQEVIIHQLYKVSKHGGVREGGGWTPIPQPRKRLGGKPAMAASILVSSVCHVCERSYLLVRQGGCAGACGLGVLGILLLGQALDGRDPDHVPVLLEEHHCTGERSRTHQSQSEARPSLVGLCGMRTQSVLKAWHEGTYPPSGPRSSCSARGARCSLARRPRTPP